MQRLPTFIWFIRAVITVFGVSGTALGVLLFVGGSDRFRISSLAYAAAIPGGNRSWSALFLLAGLGTLAGIVHGWHPKTLAVSLWALATSYLCFDISLWCSVVTTPNAPLTGGITYLELAGICLLCGVVARRLSA